MAANKEAVTSDNEGQEKPVRKQLQKASISQASGETLDMATQEGDNKADRAKQEDSKIQTDSEDMPKAASGLRKKRSFEEIEGSDVDDRPSAHTRSGHTRKRSRDSTAEEDELNNGRKVSGERKRDEAGSKAASEHNGDAEATSADRSATPEKVGKRSEERVEAMTSPKTKRSRLHSATADGAETGAAIVSDDDASTKTADKGTVTTDEPPATDAVKTSTIEAENKPSSQLRSPTSMPPGSGFGNISATSPFGAVNSPKSPSSESAQTSASAFAASGFGSLAGSSTSGFGALGKTSGGPSGGWGSKSGNQTAGNASSEIPNGTEKPVSTFGGALGQQSGFASSGGGGSVFSSGGGSAFGSKLGGGGAFGGSGFGSLGGTAGLSSFASGKASPFASGSAKPARPFGAPAEEDEEEEGGEDEDGGESGLKSPLSQTSDKQDERFYMQDHETGEEGEVTEYSCRAKLYNFAVVDEEKGKKEWKERGLGTVRLNTSREAAAADGDDAEAGAKPKARLVMRADGSHRLILNTPVQKDIKFGKPGGGPPEGGYLLFMGAVDGKKSLEMLQLKVRQQFALELYDKITELQEAM